MAIPARIGGLLALLAAPVAASDLSLALPIDCVLGESCHIQQFTDRDPGPGVADFRCGDLSYDGHKGTDFAIPTLADMARGVAVLASAAGTVAAIRDGMDDTGFTEATAAAIEGRDCGNGVVIRHDGGWETQYCHLRRGSVRVQGGDTVAAGDPLGQVGMSGRAQFPHVHITVRKDGEVVDPFDTGPGADCAASAPLWSDPPAYVPSGLIQSGFADGIPTYDAVKAGTAARTDLDRQGPALVLYGFAFGGRKGDVIDMNVIGPEGQTIGQRAELDRDQAQFFRATGRRTPPGGWPAGRYDGTVTMLRDGQEIGRQSVSIQLD
jgi:hypothetical protein